jgi:hypothetical protein
MACNLLAGTSEYILQFFLLVFMLVMNFQVIAKAPIAFGKVSLKGVMQWYKQLVAF